MNAELAMRVRYVWFTIADRWEDSIRGRIQWPAMVCREQELPATEPHYNTGDKNFAAHPNQTKMRTFHHPPSAWYFVEMRSIKVQQSASLASNRAPPGTHLSTLAKSKLQGLMPQGGMNQPPILWSNSYWGVLIGTPTRSTIFWAHHDPCAIWSWGVAVRGTISSVSYVIWIVKHGDLGVLKCNQGRIYVVVLF